MHPVIVIAYLVYLGVSAYFTYIAGHQATQLFVTTFYGDYPLSFSQTAWSALGIGFNGFVAMLLAGAAAPHREKIVNALFYFIQKCLFIKNPQALDGLKKSASSMLGTAFTGQVPAEVKQDVMNAGAAVVKDIESGDCDFRQIMQDALDQFPGGVAKLVLHLADGTTHTVAPPQYAVSTPTAAATPPSPAAPAAVAAQVTTAAPVAAVVAPPVVAPVAVNPVPPAPQVTH